MARYKSPSEDRTAMRLLHRSFSPMPSMWSLAPSASAFHISYLGSRHILADNLPAEIHERLIDICPPSRARFVVRRVAPALADRECARTRHRPVFFQVGLVAHNDEWNARVIFDANNLIAEFVQFGQGREGSDGEDEKESLTGFHVEFPVRDALALRRRVRRRTATRQLWRLEGGMQSRWKLPHSSW